MTNNTEHIQEAPAENGVGEEALDQIAGGGRFPITSVGMLVRPPSD